MEMKDLLLKKVYNSVENGQILQIYKKRTSSLSYIDASEVMKLNALSNLIFPQDNRNIRAVNF